MIANETELQTHLRRAKEALARFSEAEDTLRRELASAARSTKLAREKYQTLFIDEENIERSRRMREGVTR